MPSYPSNPAMRSGLDAQLGYMTEFTRQSFDAVRKLSELNLHFAQQLVQEAADASHQLLSCSDPFQMAAASVNAAQPVLRHLRNYQQQLLGLLTGTQRVLARTAESGMQEATRTSYAAAQDMAQQTAQAGDTFSASYHPEERRPTPPSHSGNGAQHAPG